jgi:hypothetical protein
MQPVDSYTFASEIVIPTVKEALSDRGNRRRMYVASIVTYSLVDYIAAEVGIEKSDVCNSLRKVCKPAFDEFKAFATALSTQVTSKVFSLNLAMTWTFLFSHLMCRALDGVTADWMSLASVFRRTVQSYSWIPLCRLCYSP